MTPGAMNSLLDATQLRVPIILVCDHKKPFSGIRFASQAGFFSLLRSLSVKRSTEVLRLPAERLPYPLQSEDGPNGHQCRQAVEYHVNRVKTAGWQE